MRWYDDLIGAGGLREGSGWRQGRGSWRREEGSQGTRRQGFGDLGHTLIRLRVGQNGEGLQSGTGRGLG